MLDRARAGKTAMHVVVQALLRLMAAAYNMWPPLNRYLKSDAGWIDFEVGIRTDAGSVAAAVIFREGRVAVRSDIPERPDVVLHFRTDAAVKKLLFAGPAEQVFMMLKSELRYEGNASYLNLFFFLLSALTARSPKKKRALAPGPAAPAAPVSRARPMTAASIDPGVKHLEEPYLSRYSLADFPRLERFLDIHLTARPEVCHELPKLVTDWHKVFGFETDGSGSPWNPLTRKARAFKHVLQNKKPIIREHDLIAGTTTAKDIGVVVYPEGHGAMIWSELLTLPNRALNPADVSRETLEILHHQVFPYWAKRSFKEWVREKHGAPLGQRIDERFAVYFNWKQVTISHTVPDFPKIMRLGTLGMIEEIRAELAGPACDAEKSAALEAMILCLEGLGAYSRNLAKQASAEAAAQADSARKAELLALAQACAQVVERPARTLFEAVNAAWITWVALHQESTNAGFSLGRLDQWLQPYFEADMAKLGGDAGAREEQIRRALELVGCFYMRCTDHLPLTPDLANFYFGGSSSDQAITLGGVTPEGADAVCDMTYIFLKVTEMLCLRDPNVNARFHPGVNSDAYLQRLCEVNLTTAATPSMHNDRAVMGSLKKFGYRTEDLRDWSATGCVEPTLSGKHLGHTNMQMMNMVAALEMALNDGLHPVMGWKLGPSTGRVEDGAFKTFEDFFGAFTRQFEFIIDRSIEYNRMLAQAHRELRPTPLLSSLIDGCVRKGRDVTSGGALYNSSGAAVIGLADVADSLMAIKTLVFDEKRIGFAELKKAVDSNFKDHRALHAVICKKVPLFGSGSERAVAMADRLAKWTHDHYYGLEHHRGGKYTVGFWSMSNHVIFGSLTGALPSGRLAGKPFTPGLTPQPRASKNLLDNIKDVAKLDPANITNNIAFNVKVVPSARDTREQTVRHMAAYVKTYFELGGMQIQLNVVTTQTLRDAMAHPENYRNLLVRISGYNAYFVTLNKDMQLELIERAEYAI